jgi:Protein of unknown function (DUF3102)
MAITNGTGAAAAESVSEARKNLRPLESITADICRAERQNVFTIGKLLREAKEHFPHGSWIPYLKKIEWSPRTAQLYMAVSELADKYETVAHLNAAPTAIYHLVWLAERYEGEPEEKAKVMPLAIERLRASVERGDGAAAQRDVVNLTPMAQLNPGIGELALKAASDAINSNCFGCPIRSKSMGEQADAILRANPTTEEELKAITDKHPIMMPDGKISQDDALKLADTVEESEDDEADEEAAPAPATATELLPRQCALVGRFDDACGELLKLAAKASAVFTTSIVDDVDLDMLGNFLKQIAASKRKARPPEQHDDLEIPEFLRRVPSGDTEATQ